MMEHNVFTGPQVINNMNISAEHLDVPSSGAATLTELPLKGQQFHIMKQFRLPLTFFTPFSTPARPSSSDAKH